MKLKEYETKSKFPIEPFGKFIEKIQYGTSELAEKDTEGIPVIRMNNLKDNSWDFSDLKYMNLSNEEFERYRLDKGDILFNRTNSKELVGKCAVFEEKGSWVFASYLIRVKLNDKLLPKYASAILSSNLGRFQVDGLSRQIAGMTNINAEEIKTILLPIPPVEFQHKVIKFLDEELKKASLKRGQALDIISSIDRTIAQEIGFTFPTIVLKKTFAAKVSELENRIDPHFYLPGFKALVDNLRQINHEQLGNIVEFSNETWNQKDGFEDEFPYIEISEIDLTSGKIQNISYIPISEAPSRARMMVRANDIIVSTTRPHRGAIAFINEAQHGYIASTGFAVLRKLLLEDVNKEYLFYILRTQICLQQMLQRSSGGSYPAITTEELKKIYIPIPSLKVQLKIVTDIKKFIDKAEALKEDAKIDLEKAKQDVEALILS